MQQTSEPRRPRPSRGDVSGYLALTAIVSDGLLLILSSGDGPNLGLPLAILAAGSWILAVLVLSPIRDASASERGGKRAGRVASLAALAHVLAFLLPAAAGSVGLDAPATWVPGYVAFAVGLVIVPLAWLANPIFMVALALYRRGQHRRASTLSVVATVLALSAWFTLQNVPVGPGFLLWATSPALLAIAATLAGRTVAASAVTTPSDS